MVRPSAIVMTRDGSASECGESALQRFCGLSLAAKVSLQRSRQPVPLRGTIFLVANW